MRPHKMIIMGLSCVLLGTSVLGSDAILETTDMYQTLKKSPLTEDTCERLGDAWEGMKTSRSRIAFDETIDHFIKAIENKTYFPSYHSVNVEESQYTTMVGLLRELKRKSKRTRIPLDVKEDGPKNAVSVVTGPAARLASNQSNYGHQQRTKTTQKNAAMQQQLPDGWDVKVDPKTGKTYYVNHTTQSTQWKHPADLPAELVDSILFNDAEKMQALKKKVRFITNLDTIWKLVLEEVMISRDMDFKKRKINKYVKQYMTRRSDIGMEVLDIMCAMGIKK